MTKNHGDSSRPISPFFTKSLPSVVFFSKPQTRASHKTPAYRQLVIMKLLDNKTDLNHHVFSTPQLCQITGIDASRATRWVQDCVLRPNGAERCARRQWRFVDVYVAELCESLRRRGLAGRAVFKAIANCVYTGHIGRGTPILTICWGETRYGFEVQLRSREATHQLIEAGTSVLTVDVAQKTARLAEDVAQQLHQWEATRI